ncbi:MAG: clostripain-related cysteine peptidase [Bacteroidota bacterium]
MNKTRILLFTLLTFAFSWQLDAQQAKWTYMVYLFGSDLEGGFENYGQYQSAGTNDMEEMTKAGATSNVNVIITTGGTDRDGWRTIRRWRVENGERIEIPFNAPNDRMGDPDNLTEFVNWATANYPAENYVLDMWNHGADIQGYGGDELPQNNHETISIPDLASAIKRTNFIGSGNKFEVLGFDACLMANLEVHSNLYTTANYIVSSEQTEPGTGWDYEPIVRAMQNGTVSNGEQLGRVIADGFLAQCLAFQQPNVTLSVVEASQVPNVISAVEGMFNAVGSDGTADLQAARARSEDYGSANTSQGQGPEDNHDVVDIGHLAANLKLTNSTYSGAADAVINAINSAVKYEVKDRLQPEATGLTIFLPHRLLGGQGAAENVIQQFYDPIDFSSSIKSFVKSYTASAQQGDNQAPDGEYGDPDGDYDDWEDFSDDGGLRPTVTAKARNSNDNPMSRVIVNDPRDLETVRVLLVEKGALEDQNDFLTLGAVEPDALRYSADGRLLIEYEWDQEWLGIDGFPVNIASIKQTALTRGGGPFQESEGENNDDRPEIEGTGSISGIRRGGSVQKTIVVPAVLNPDEDFFGQDVYLNYLAVENGYELISVVPKRVQGEPNVGQKIRLSLNPGDRVMLLYDGFNEVTDESFDAVDQDAVFTIETGNEDLNLEPILLPLQSEFQLGFQLTDFSQQDTIIFDPRTFETTEIDAGQVLTSTGAATIDVCSGDGTSDILSFQSLGCAADNFRYVLTTDEDFVLGPLATGTIEFEGAPAFGYRVYGVAYKGDLTINYGDNILNSDLATEDYMLTSNFVTVNVADASTCGTLGAINRPQLTIGRFNRELILTDVAAALAQPANSEVIQLGAILSEGADKTTFKNTFAYPNPTKDVTFLDLTAYDGQVGLIEVNNLLGQTVQTVEVGTIQGSPVALDMATLETGLYLVRVHVDGRWVNTHKILKEE